MLKNKIIVRKIRNIVILLMVIIVMVGAYRNIGRSRAEDIIEIEAIALDNYGYLEDEKFMLEAKDIGDDLYEVQLPESINTKVVEKVKVMSLQDNTVIYDEDAVEEEVNTTLTEENATQEENVMPEEQTQKENEVVVGELIDNKIVLTKEQIENKPINLKVVYERVLLNKAESGEYIKTYLKGMTDENMVEMQIPEESEFLYNKILKYEDVENGKLVEVKGYLPVDAKLQIEEVNQEKIATIFGETKINVAYDIKIIREIITQVPTDEANPNAPVEEIVETIEIKPEDYNEICEVLIKDVNITENALVYHVKEDNTYENIVVKENTKENVSFDAHTFSIYAVGMDPDISDEDIMAGAGILFSPASGSYTTGKTVYVDSDTGSERIVGIKITTTSQQPSTWDSIDGGAGITNYTYTFKTVGTWYIWIYTNWGSWWCGGPYHISAPDTTAPWWPNTVHNDANVTGDGWTNADSQTLTLNAKDNVGVSYYSWRYDNGSESGTCDSTATFYAEQYEKVYFRPYDAAGNYGPEEYAYVMIDRTPPTAGTLTMKLGSSSGSNYANGAWTNQSVYIAKVDGADVPCVGDSSVKSGHKSTTYTVVKDGTTVYTNRTDPVTLDPGSGNGATYTITVTTTDNAGNTASNSYTVKIDKAAPTGTLTASPSKVSGTTYYTNASSFTSYVSSVADTGGAGISTVTFFAWYGTSMVTYNKHVTGTWDSTNSRYYTAFSFADIPNTSTNATSQGEGRYTVHVHIQDKAGNTTIQGINVIYDKTKPTITVSPSSCSWRNSALSTTITTIDPTTNAADGKVSGLPSATTYQYYLSNSSTALNSGDWTGDAWTTYTSGTAISLNPGVSGTYYLFVKRVTDRAGNKSTAKGTATTIGSTTYQRFGPYQFDYIKPTATASASTYYTNQPTVTVYASNVADTGGSGLKTNPVYMVGFYGQSSWGGNGKTAWAVYDSTNNRYYQTFTFSEIHHTVTGDTNNGDGKYYFSYHIYDNAGNINYPGTNVIYDTTSPTISVSPDKTETWRNSALRTTITVADPTTNASDGNVAGLATTNSYQYYLSESSTSLVGGTWKAYASGTAISLEPSDKTKDKEYYLFIKRVSDKAGNISSSAGTLTTIGAETYHKFGPYKFDYVKPAIQYTHQSIDIDKNNKTYTMTFKGVDNHYSSGVFTLDQLTILMQNGQLDASGNPIVYNLKNEPVTLGLKSEALSDGTGYTYTLTISNLEQLEIKSGLTTADYSGIITVAVPANVMVDLAGNKNDATTITTGVEIPGGTGSGVPIDVVDPRWDKVSSIVDIDNKTISLTVKGTDTYFHQSTLTTDKINVLINGALVTEGINITLSSATVLNETRKVNGTNKTVQYGVQYTITITGFDTSIEQLKVQLPSGTLVDQYGNTNKLTEFILYNYLKWTGLEKGPTSGFLGNTNIQRQNIDTVTFVAGIEDANETQWDASARGDNSIIAWYTTNANGSLKVYIGSNDAIFANRDSSYLFAHIGYGEKCTSTQPITNLGSLITASVKNMTAMFAFTGYRSMTSLDVSSLNTKNVTNMREMFNGTGYKNMTSITFGSNFDTSKVTDMSWMFANFGYTKLTSMTLPSNFTTANVTDMSYMFANYGYTAVTSLSVATFDTTKVTDMSYMFSNCGYTAMTSLTLGSINTANVTDMSHMFAGTGYTKLASISLGTNFNTASVTDMSGMFENFGYTALVSLDLGDVFSTMNVTNMSDMFNGCGYTAMTSLDLGQAFTNIPNTHADFVTNTGKSGNCTIYAPEAIYKNIGEFKSEGLSVLEDAPYIPTGYIHVAGTTLETGFVVQDGSGNEFVWIEVPKTSAVYRTAGLNITEFSSTELTAIEIDLQTYTTEYRDSWCNSKDSYSSAEATGIASSDEYNALKNKMLKSVYLNGGFYVGRYETGTATGRTSPGDSLTTAVIKQNMYPYNNVTTAQAQGLAEGFASEGYTSSMLFGVQWDLIMKYLETKGVSQADLATDSTSWGNYQYSTCTITNTSAKYYIPSTGTWTDGAYGTKASGTSVYLSTGASETFKKQNIYDLAGNVEEYTLEYCFDPSFPIVLRGGSDELCASFRSETMWYVTDSNYSGVFRVALYADGQQETAGENAEGEAVGIEYERGKLNPKYRPKWSVTGTTITNTSTDKKIDITLTGATNANYTSNVTTSLAAEDISVWIDGTQLTGIGKLVTTPSPTTGATLTHTLTLANFEEALRQAGKLYKEWSGNITLKIAGRGEDASTYGANVLVDSYGNQSMMENDETDGTWVEINFKDATASNANTNGKLFADFIKPEIVYEYVEGDINYTAKTVTVVFTVADKYYSNTSTGLTAEDLLIFVDGELPGDTNGNDVLDAGETFAMTRELTSTDITATVDGVENTVIGKQYTLTISEMAQDVEASGRSYLDYAGVVTVAIPAGKIVDYSVNGNAAKTITVGVDLSSEETPYIPEGYTQVEGTDLSNGLTIQDASGNQFVWVEVPQSTTVYQTAGLEITAFTDEEFGKIEADLQEYTSAYKKDKTGFADTWSSETATGLTEANYNTLKKKMLKSIYKNGGFYVGKYETGTNTVRTSPSATLTTAVIQPNAYPYNYLTTAQAQSLASGFKTSGYETSLMFGVQWDLTMKYLESKGVSEDDLNTDSTAWGNYLNSIYTITNTNAKYSTDNGVTWSSSPYSKAVEISTMLTTGASDTFSKQNIYDLVGNMAEWTLELDLYNYNPVTRGSDYNWSAYASVRGGGWAANSAYSNGGFRVALYRDEGTDSTEPEYTWPYLPTGYTKVEGTNLSNGLTIQDSVGNQYVWVEVPRSAAVYKTAGVNITGFSSTELTAIETDLRTYSSAYRTNAASSVDEYDTDEVGLTSTEYDELKKKMLKSVYENGGFYIGRYETGIDYNEEPRIDNGDTTQTPVIKQNAYPYNFVTTAQSQALAESFETTGYKTSMLFGVQWDLTLKYLETKGTDIADLNSDSTSWGNYSQSSFTITNSSAKYTTGEEANNWLSAPYTKAAGEGILLTTGASEIFSKQNIYDLAGNLSENTLETHTNVGNAYPQSSRGGKTWWSDFILPASFRNNSTHVGWSVHGFRVALYAETNQDANRIWKDTPTIVDLVDPKWTVEVGEEGSGTVGIKLRAIDEYFAGATLDADDITIYVNGVANTVVTKDLTTIPPVDITDTVDGVANTVVGKEYTLLLGNLNPGTIEYEEFTPKNAIVGGTAKYRKDNSGQMTLDIAAGTIFDTSGNTSEALEDVDLGNFDTTQLEVFKVQSNKDTTNKTETIIFNVTDRNYDKTDLIGLDTDNDGDIDDINDELTISIDGVEIDEINVQSLSYVEIITTVDGAEKVVGHQYTLVLNEIDETNAEFIASGRDYRELSGTISIEIASTAARDSNGNIIDPATTTVVGDLVDFIAPEIKYTHQSTDIKTGTKQYVMTFTYTDKYYSSGVLTTEDIVTNEKIEILMQNGQVDGSGNPIVYNLKDEPVTLAISATPIEKTFNKTVSGSVVSGTYTIGHTYTLTISNLEQLERKTGMKTADYSGIITVSIDGNMIKDTSNNGNSAETITAGVSIHGGTESGTPVEVDVVDPIWEKVSSSALAKTPAQAVDANATTGTATITVKGTDTYLDATDSSNSYDDSTLTSDEIAVYIDGVYDSSITPVIGTVTKLEETRRVYDFTDATDTETVQYGVQYTITINGWKQSANQVKIKILEDAIKDETGNGNKEKTFMIYNCLEETSLEISQTDGFLDGNSVFATTGIQRKQIQQVIFVDSLAGSTAAGVQKVWDVSAMTDGSIKAWTSQTETPYTVYIGSNDEIFANQNSSYLFNWIGYAGPRWREPDYTATATETISNISLLNTSSVTDMSRMFYCCGYTAMTSLDLGDNFDTSNVTDMGDMFNSCGETAMTSLDLGDKFDTSNATTMSRMFSGCGYTAMTSLDLGALFDTSSVEDMAYMFSLCGYTAMTSLDLGDLFDTSNVIDMTEMFYECGYTAMTSLDLGDLFDTSSVEVMDYMFAYCGYTAMTSLDLGPLFDTSSVEDMSYMFAYCGYTKMTSLDLGDKFDTSSVGYMKGMFEGCGYTAMTSLDLGALFNTSNVEDMGYMFANCGYTAMTSLDLGDLFDTNNVTSMVLMFQGCGQTAMTSLDLGPAFTYIPNTMVSVGPMPMNLDDEQTPGEIIAYTDMLLNTGKSGQCVIYAPESIYKNRNALKLSSTDTTATPDDLKYTRGTVQPKYKPEWSVTGTTVTNSGTNQKIDIVLTGGVNTANYTSNVTTTLSADDITVWIDGTQITGVGKSLPGGTSTTRTLTLTNFEEALRQAGKLYKEWSGNIALRIAGRGEATSTYTANVLKDSFGNQSMMETDEAGATWIEVELKDATPSTANTNGKLFADFIKPEIVYSYSNTDIDHEDKEVTVVFTIADKYYASENLTLDELTIMVDGVIPGDDNGNGVLDGSETYKIDRNFSSSDLPGGIGKQYTLVISEMEQPTETGTRKYLDYAGIVTIAIPSGQVLDNSGNSNAAKTITIGEKVSPEGGTTSPYLPTGFTYVDGTNLSNGLTIQDGSGNQYVWIEVPRDLTVYDEIGIELDLDTLSGTDLTSALDNIELELQEYATYYRRSGYTDTWYSEAQHGFASSDDYNELKYTMLKSVYKYGGFYIGKYETGTATARNSSSDALTDAVIQQNAYPYNYVTNKQAQSLASEMISGDYTSSLMFGLQWDLVLQYLENKGVTREEINNSTNWGNHLYSTCNITNVNSKYSTGSFWTERPYGLKEASNSVIYFSTGADTQFCKMGIYDLAGNVEELTLESYFSGEEIYCVYRGGDASARGTAFGVKGRGKISEAYTQKDIGFRVALYKNTTEETATGPQIVDIVDPKWSIEPPANNTSSTVEVKLRAIDEYFKEATLDLDDITIKVNGVTSTSVTKDITTIPPVDITDTVDGVANTVVGKEYTLILGNLIPGTVSYTDFTPTNLNQLDEPTRGTYQYKYKTEYGGEVVIEIAAGTIEDTSGNKNRPATLEAGNIDAVGPGIFEVRKTQNASGNTETIVFNVTDKNFDKTDLITKSEMALYMDNIKVDSLLTNATLSSPVEIKATVDGTEKVVGHQYTLVVNNIAETTKQTGKDYLEWSGTLRLDINAGAAKDITGNHSDLGAISDFVDYIKPQLEPITVANPINTSAKTYTMSFKILDKYFDTTNALDASEISVYIDGELDGDTNRNGVLDAGETPSITKTLTNSPITVSCNKTISGAVTSGNQTIGQTYTLVLGGFEQATKQSGKDFMEWSGTVKIVINTNAVNDTTGNTLDTDVTKRTVNGQHVDFIKPVLEEVEPTATIIAEDATNKTETIVFNIMDKYLDTTNTLDTSEITVYVDGEAVTVDYTNSSSTGLNGVFTKVQDFKYTVNGDTNHIVGQQYKLVLSNFDQITRNAKEYKDYSGTVSIELATNAIDDTSNNLLDASLRTVTGDFVDYIKPDIEYTHQSSDVDTGNKKYTMTFTITDKYYSTGVLTLNDIAPTDGSEPKIEILMQNGQLDGSGNPIVYNLKDELDLGNASIALSSTPITKTFNKTVSGAVVTGGTYTIGHTYTLTISNLERLERKTGMTTSDYSGVIDVSIDGEMIKDTSNNGNSAKTITAGVNFVGGVESGTPVEVDVVDPIWEKVSSSALAKTPAQVVSATATTGTATITIKGTDTYFATTANGFAADDSTLTSDEIEVYIDGTKVTSITPSISTVTPLEEERRVYDSATNETVQYGVQYTITINGWKQSANQVKIKILEDAIKDETGNGNKEKEFIIYNCLESSATEQYGYDGFLDGNGIGESGATTGIKRNEIQQVVFVNSLEDAPMTVAGDGTITLGTNCWDVSAISDKSILAWTLQTAAPYTVYVGSDNEIFANQNASFLFNRIGHDNWTHIFTETEAIVNIEKLNVSSVTNMEFMFYLTGNSTMTSLDLGEKFDTSNVTDMNSMFYGCGETAMITLDLGEKFDTGNVTNMKRMFYQCGKTAMTSLNLGTKFNTSKVTTMVSMFEECGYSAMTSLDLSSGTSISNTTQFNTISVTNMQYMFKNCGYTAMISLNFGSNFNTSNVTNMTFMFTGCGYSAMTSLTLPNSFDTGKVTDMNSMFDSCGYTAMTNLDLGDSFDTSKVTNMYRMFSYCGYTAMTSLDLGDLFYTTSATTTQAMFYNCGNTAMTVLDLGPAFTKIPSNNTDMFTNCGTSNLKVYAPESIYSDRTSLKLNN